MVSRREWGFRFVIAASLFLGHASAPVLGSEPHRRPRIRTITAFVRIEPSRYRQQIEEAVTVLRHAEFAFEKNGYQVQTIRITTQPFTQYIGERPAAEALDFFKSLDEQSKKESFLLNIGPLTLIDASNVARIELLSHILASTRANTSVVVADENGVHWNAIQAAARVMKYVENNSPNGVNNFDFAAVAMMTPYGPFFPSSNHDGAGRQFSVGWEAGAFVTDVLSRAGRNMQAARELLSQEFEQEARTLAAIATQVENDSRWKYMGLDPTPAPGIDSSIGAAIEKLSGSKVGFRGTLSAAAVITDAELSIPIKRVGFAGLMLPVLEDPVLAERWSEGTLDVDSLLAYSAVCGTGLDTVPLPGDVSQEQLERIIGDMASIAFKWHKPLTARLIPAPGKKAGDRTDFDFGPAKFPNTTVRLVR
jgi:uncharacterized protein